MAKQERASLPDRQRSGSDAVADGAAPGQEVPQPQRIAKLMARVGLCSRREAETWIVAGRVSVNGETLTSPARDVSSGDLVLVDGAPLPTADRTRLFLFHKPRGLVTSDHDPEGRPTVADFLREHWPAGPRTVTVGRLDINTEGLLLLTNDGGLARVLELPQTGWVRRYRVRAKGTTDQAKLDALRDGIVVDGVEYAGIEATLDRTQGANSWMTLALREGKNREIKRVLETLGLEVNRLIRLSFGPFQLLELAEGAVEEVRPRVLRDQLGEALAARAGVIFAEVEARDDAVPKASRPKPPRIGAARQTVDGKRPDKPDRVPPRSIGGERPRARARTAAAEGRSDEPAVTVRERPQRSARKHVSALRTADAATVAKGPRRRIERSDTRDRHDRTITVERLVTTRTKEPNSRGKAVTAPTRKTDRHLSPSAQAKRVRTARSGNSRGPESQEGKGERRLGGDRPRQRRGRPGEEVTLGGAGRGVKTDRPSRDAVSRTAPRAGRGASIEGREDRRPKGAGRGTAQQDRKPRERGGEPRSSESRGVRPSRVGNAASTGRRDGSQASRPTSGRPHGPASADRPKGGGGGKPPRGRSGPGDRGGSSGKPRGR